VKNREKSALGNDELYMALRSGYFLFALTPKSRKLVFDGFSVWQMIWFFGRFLVVYG